MKMFGTPQFAFDDGFVFDIRDSHGSTILVMRDAKRSYDTIWFDVPAYSVEKLARAVAAFNEIIAEPEEIKQAAE